MIYDYQMEFELTRRQLVCSKKLVSSYLAKRDVVLDAVCGAGKTEMLLEVIKAALNENKRVGFACPRKQLTIELYARIKEYFNHPQIGLVVGGIAKNIQSNFIFLTTHQLIKYENYFDLLIIDEIDAFPYCDNYELECAALQASKQFIYVSATVPQKYYQKIKQNELDHIYNYERFHGQAIPNVNFMKVNRGNIFIKLLKLILKYRHKLIIFVPSIKAGQQLTKQLRLLRFKVENINSKTLNNTKLNQFKNNDLGIIVSTTVLERGITVKGLNIIIYDCSNAIFTSTVLIQMAGRVGRDLIEYQGKIHLLGFKQTQAIRECMERIDYYNEMSGL